MFFLILVFIFSTFDSGPKPSMSFRIINEVESKPSIIEGYQLQSNKEEFMMYDTLDSKGPQRFECPGDTSCFSISYGYSRYSKLLIHFDDKVRESNVFTTNVFKAEFDVIVKDNELLVIETTPLLRKSDEVFTFLKALLLTLFTELSAAFVLFIIFKIERSLLWTLLVANFITLPLVWFVFPLLGNVLMVIIFAEIFAVVFEALFMYYGSRKIIPPGKAFSISLIVNFFSFFTGGLIYIILAYN